MKTRYQIIMLAITLGLSLFVNAQGENLFKAKCNTCHLLGKNSTGPNLKGVKQKWNDAGEGEMLIEWVKNSTGLIASGKSKMANEIKGFSPTDMPPQAVSPEEVNAILDYVDAYVEAPTTPPDSTTGVATNITYVPNYKDNLDLFYWLLIGVFIELLAILIISNSIISLVKSDYFQKKLEKKKQLGGTIVKAIAILLSIGFIASQNTSLALSFTAPGEATEPTLWLLVENSDIYFMVVINVILLGVIFYLRNMFRNFLRMIKSEEEKAAEVPSLKKINQVLTDVVPIEEEHRIMLHHEYDGIRELDNNLPPWWVWGFVATVVFAIIYLFNYHIFKTADLQIVAYNKEIKKADKEVKAYLSKMAMNVDETNATLLTDAADISKGGALFKANCVVCHNPKGEGNIGPNLTDKSWIYGYDIKEVFKTVKIGTPNGMPEHNSKLNPIQIQQVASYVLQLPETAGKKAEGTITEK